VETGKIALMSSLTRNIIVLALVFCCPGLQPVSRSQTGAPKKPMTASVSGRITVGGKGRGGISVGLRSNNFSATPSPTHKATTDADGNYRIADVPPGTYYVAPMSSLFVPADSNPVSQMGKPLLLSEGESVEGIDFAMVRASVITGKVTEADGRPVIEQRVSVIVVDQPNQRSFYPLRTLFQTDDRGVYRMFGLRAGRYKVAVGQTDDGIGGGSAPGRTGYQPVFYPNATSVDQAKIIELGEGDQATNIDITMSRKLPGLAATGTVVNGETNQPVNNVRIGLAKMNDERNSFLPITALTNQKGEFRLENIPPGTYSTFLTTQADSDLRADALEFQLVDQDVTGLVIRTMRGATISGTVVVEGTNDGIVIAKVHQLRIYAWVQGGNGSSARPSLVSADGSFRLSPLPAGIANFEFAALDYSQQTGFIMSRIERDGVVVPRGGFDIKAGEQISGVKIVLSYGSGSVRGTVNFENGSPAPGMRFLVFLHKPGDDDARLPQREVDARGRFMIEGVPPGTYELYVSVFNPGSRERRPPMQSITVADGAVTDVVISIDLAPNP
jgi:5-hydroxyisourate hydrolase-like protein (transthyretin family)